jgi:hypothetical protein
MAMAVSTGHNGRGAAWLLFGLLLSLASGPACSEGGLPLILKAVVPLPGRATRFDYQSEDPDSRLLFISHMGDGSVVVFDTRSGKLVKELAGFPVDTGVNMVPALGRVYISVTGSKEGEVAVLDAKTFAVLARIPAGRFPDGSAYVPYLSQLYVSDESGEAEIVINANTNIPLRTLPLGGEAGMSAYDPVTGHVFVNVQSLRQLDEIDPKTGKIVGLVALPSSCDHNHGLLLYPERRLAFIACDGNARLLVLELVSHVALVVLPTGEDPDVLALDEKRGLLYVASESGTLSVYKVEDHRVTLLGQGDAGDNAHTVSVDPQTGLVYLPIRNLDGHPALKIMAPPD